jgi:sugar (pentulose or hexulose) kinase
MFLGFDNGACSVKAVLLDSDDRVARAATLDAVCRRAWRIETFQADAARAATFTASRAGRRGFAPFAKEISQ